MDNLSFDNTFILFGLLLFIAVFLGVEGLYSWWNSNRGPEARTIARRLQSMSAGGQVDRASSTLLKQRLLADRPLWERTLMALPRVSTLDRLLVQAGTQWTVTSFLSITFALFLVGVFGCLVMRLPMLLAVIVGVMLASVPLQVALFKRARRLTRFETLLPEALDLIGRGLRAGHSFPSALQMVGDELPDPVGPEFQQTFDEINFGIPAQTALQNLVHRMPSTDLRFFVIAVLIQRDTGGNLSEVLDNISAIIRDRLKLFGKVKTLSAEGRMSGWILTLLPFGTGLLLYTVNPEMTALLWTDETGRRMVYWSLGLMVTGILWMSRIVKIRV